MGGGVFGDAGQVGGRAAAALSMMSTASRGIRVVVSRLGLGTTVHPRSAVCVVAGLWETTTTARSRFWRRRGCR